MWIDLFKVEPGTTVRYQAKGNDDVLTYVAFLKAYNNGVETSEKMWTAGQLREGVGFVFGNVDGYQIILRAQGDPTKGVVETKLKFNGKVKSTHKLPAVVDNKYVTSLVRA